MQNKGQNKQWYVLYVNVRHEKKVHEKFVEQNIESYLPIVKTLKQWSDRKKIVEEPLRKTELKESPKINEAFTEPDTCHPFSKFLLGVIAGLGAVLMPCIYSLIP